MNAFDMPPLGPLGAAAKQKALRSATQSAPHPLKTAPDPEPPVLGRIVSPPPAVVDLAEQAHALAAFRPHLDFRALRIALEDASAHLPSGTAPRLVALAEERLAGRSLTQLSATDMDGLRDDLRRQIARSAPGTKRLQRILRDRMRGLRGIRAGGGMLVSTARVQGGVWIFFHTRAAPPEIVGEAFLPLRRGAPLPARFPDPAQAGLVGQPRWWDAQHRLSPVRPPHPPTVRASSELGSQALELGPELVLDAVGRAEQAAQAAQIRSRAVLPTARTTKQRISTSDRILDYDVSAAEVAGGEWDTRVRLLVRTGPEVTRLPSTALDGVLSPPGTLDPTQKNPALRNLARCHALGPVLGDETLLGLAYGPHEAFNLLQVNTVEAFARWDFKRTGRLNFKAETTMAVSVYLAHIDVGGKKVPFLRAAHYEVELDDGQFAKFVLTIDGSGRVTKEVRIGAGEGLSLD
ncbi:hypothetical protein [Streptomyces fructofermentans]|uniref:hypothetical protein n=1 Tax=Streptomyces fructofermentans TaxID=152141 RepID=UPI00378BCD9F